MKNKKIMNKINCGLFVLTARDGEKDNGCIINTVMQVTSTPNRITISVNKGNYTHDIIQKPGVFNVSILNEDSKFATYQNFGFQSGREADKFEQIEYARSENGLIYLTAETNGYISAKVLYQINLDTHTLFIAEVTDGDVLSEVEPVTYSFYHKSIKPAAPKADEKKKGWVCTICGYIYEGEVLPPDFVCPICKHGADDFRPL